MTTRFLGRVLALAFVLVLTGGIFAAADGPDNGDTPVPKTQSAAIAQVRFDQNLGAQLPLDATFTDETGAQKPLSAYFGDRPVILVLSYFRCPNLCGLVYSGLVSSLQQIDFTAGDQFDVIIFSIDPTDTAADAAAKKAELLAKYNRPESADGWHLLTVDSDAQMKKVADVVGFSYVYNEKIKQYAHPAGIVVATPQGKLTRYLYGLEFPANDLRLSLVEGAENKIGSPVDQILLRCFHYDPNTGQYTLAIMNIIRFAGIVTVLVMGFVWWVWTKRRKRSENTAI